MASIRINPDQIIGKIKPMHGVGQPPLGGLGKAFFQHFHYLTECGAPFSRLHDVGGDFGGGVFVDIPNIFRNFDADENDPASYDFAFTDALITALVEAGVEPYYRLGITIEHQTEIRPCHTAPPADYAKWSRICEHIIAHYIDGWADGFKYRITYWEIWNEPDDPNELRSSMMWSGTAEDFYRLYDVTAKHLKAVFGDRIKVGGYGSSAFYGLMSQSPNEFHTYWAKFFYGFFDYIQNSGAPLDFFSWHSYDPPKSTIAGARRFREELDTHGYTHTESHLNEWNPHANLRGTAQHSAEVMAMMLGMQNAPVDILTFYDARLGAYTYNGLFNPMTSLPWHAYYSLAAFHHLYTLENQVALQCDTEEVYALAATKDGKTVIVIANISGKTVPLDIEGISLAGARYSVIDQPRLLSWSPAVKELAHNTVLMIEIG